MNVCIFCGSRPGNSDKIIRQTKEMCQGLIRHDFHLVYGGGKSGLMGIVADQFLAAGQQVTGVRPKKLIADEAMHHDLTELLIVENMFERKDEMIRRSDVFIAIPGGIGTLDEIMEVYTHIKIGFIDKFCILLDVDNYYEGLEILLKQMVTNDFLKEEDRKLLHISKSPEDLVKAVVNYREGQR